MDHSDTRGTLVVAALAWLFGLFPALGRAVIGARRHFRLQAAAHHHPITVYTPERAVPVLPALPPLEVRPDDVAPATVRFARVRSTRNLRAAFADAHAADTAPVDPLTGPVANWAAFAGQESPLAAVTARDIHAGRVGDGELRHTGLTIGGPSYRQALLQAGISPDGPMEKLDPDDTGAAA